MNPPTDLSRRSALASQELRSQLPPATLLPSIHRRLQRGRWNPRQSRGRWLAWFGWAGLSAATVALAATLVVNSMLAADTPPAPSADADGFVRLVNPDVWQRAQDDAGRTWVVNAEMPQSRLAALGLPYDPARAGERMPAQLLMHSSGEVLAVRLNR